MADTGTSNCVYNLISILDNSLKGAQLYDQYIQDAEREGSQDLAEFFRDVREKDKERSERAKKLLADHLSHWVEVFNDHLYDDPTSENLSLNPYGYRWFEVTRQVQT